MSSLYDELYARAGIRDFTWTPTYEAQDTRQMDNFERQEYARQARDDAAARSRARDAWSLASAQKLQKAAQQHGTERQVSFNNYAQSQRDALAARRATALQQQMQHNQQMRTQAQRTLSQPTASSAPSLAPLQAITGVALNDELGGTSAANQSFYVSPDNSQSQYNIGQPLGSGIGGRQRASTNVIAGESDTLGSKKKEEM